MDFTHAFAYDLERGQVTLRKSYRNTDGVQIDIMMRKIENIVREAGQIIRSAQLEQSDIHQKDGPANFVTDYDVRVQAFLIEKLSEIVPDASFFGEEETEGNKHRVGTGYTFFIDPIDGTTNFMFDYQFSCVSVGLAENGSLIAGWVYNPYADRMYHAVKGQGAFLNDKRLKIEDGSIADGIVAFGCARYNDREVDLLFDIVQELFLRSLSVRNGGSAALDLSRVASGSHVGFFEFLLQPYDYAAATAVIEEAGGMVCQPDSAPIVLDRPCSIVAGTKKAVEEILEIYAEKSGSRSH